MNRPRVLLLGLVASLAVIAFLLAGRYRTDNLDRPLGYMNFDCCVINMKKDAVRMKAFSDAYARCDIAAEHGLIRWEGTDGRELSLPQHVSSKALHEILRAERLKYRQKHYELTRGAIGCWMSHVGLWKSLLDSDKQAMVIFEDDAVMSKRLLATMRGLRPPADWDIVLLGYFCNKCETQPQGETIKVTRFFGLHGYVINRKFVETFLASPGSRVVTKQIDSVLSDMAARGSINVYAAPTQLVRQNNRDHPTTIQMSLKTVKGVDAWAVE